MGSKRLPNKALLKIAGRPVLEWIVLRLKSCKELDQVVLSITDQKKDDVLERLAEKLSAQCFRGSETDLIQRLLGTARAFGADVVVRITGDCPLTDPDLIDRMVREFRSHMSSVDFVTNTYQRTYPDGLDIDILPLRTLERMNKEVKVPYYREYLTYYIMENPTKYRILNIAQEQNLSTLRWTLDYPEDLKFMRRVYSALKKHKGLFKMKDVLDLIKRNPQLTEINKHLAPADAPKIKSSFGTGVRI